MGAERDHLTKSAAPPSGATPLAARGLVPLAPVPLPALNGVASTDRLSVGHAEDAAELDADRAADVALSRLRSLDVMGADALPARAAVQVDAGCAPLRRCAGQPSPGAVGHGGGVLDSDTSSTIQARLGGGTPLDAAVRRRMERGFGADLSSVRIHADDTSARLNAAVSARAFTTGQDIFFNRDQFAPGTPSGDRVLAHELAHTLQHPPGGRAGATIRRSPLVPTASWEPTVHGQGRRMRAVVRAGPAKQLPTDGGSRTDNSETNTGAPRAYMRLFGAATPRPSVKYVQGHLLNAELGGPGQGPAQDVKNRPGVKVDPSQNLTAFSVITNQSHKDHIENSLNQDANGWFLYEVDISYGHDDLQRLRERVSWRLGLAEADKLITATGMTATDKTYAYASHLSTTWWKLIDDPAGLDPGVDAVSYVTGAGAPAKVEHHGSAQIRIPSPNTMLLGKPGGGSAEDRQEEELGELPTAGSYRHDPVFKGDHSGHLSGKLPTGANNVKNVGAVKDQTVTKPHVQPIRWKGTDAARVGGTKPTDAIALKGYDSYGRGVEAAFQNLAATGPLAANRNVKLGDQHWGRGHTLGEQDFRAGVTIARSSATASTAHVGAQRGLEAWTNGVTAARSNAPRPTDWAGAEAHDTWMAGVTAARSNAPRPTGWAGAEAHDTWMAGVTAARSNAPRPTGWAGAEAHDTWMAGVTAARSNAPRPTGWAGAEAHDLWMAGVVAARAGQPRPTDWPGTEAHDAWTAGVTAARDNDGPPADWVGNEAYVRERAATARPKRGLDPQDPSVEVPAEKRHEKGH